jgi:hypothetical protein
MAKKFLCPECGSAEAKGSEFVETVYKKGDVWSVVALRYLCGRCQSVVPAHLGERWDGLSIKEGRDVWQKVYRDSQPKWGGKVS